MQWLEIEDQGLVLVDRIVAVGASDSAPVRRLIATLPLTKVVSLTGGRRRRTVIVLDSDHVVLTALSVTQVRLLIAQAQLKQPGTWS